MLKLPRSRRARSMVAAGVIGALAAGLVAAADPATATQAAASHKLTLPAPTGHHGVGTVSLHLVDHAREDPWVAGHQARELMISVWYPATDTARYPVAPWMEPGAAALFLAEQHVPPGTVTAPDTAGHLGAPVDRRGGPRPVVLYSPGLQADRSASTVLVQQLASEGYVVVTIDHTHDAAEVEFPGGRIEVSALPSDDPPVVDKAVDVRAADTSFVLDQLTALDHGKNPDVDHATLPRGIAGALDLSRVGMFGWSDGGATTGLAMQRDRRIRAGVSLDGSFYGSVPANGLDRPLLLVGEEGHTRTTDQSWATLWPNLRGGRLELELLGSKHATFTDSEYLVPQVLPIPGVPVSALPEIIGTLPTDRAAIIEESYLTAFFDQHLRHRHSRLLDGPSARFPEMRFIP